MKFKLDEQAECTTKLLWARPRGPFDAGVTDIEVNHRSQARFRQTAPITGYFLELEPKLNQAQASLARPYLASRHRPGTAEKRVGMKHSC